MLGFTVLVPEGSLFLKPWLCTSDFNSLRYGCPIARSGVRKSLCKRDALVKLAILVCGISVLRNGPVPLRNHILQTAFKHLFLCVQLYVWMAICVCAYMQISGHRRWTDKCRSAYKSIHTLAHSASHAPTEACTSVCTPLNPKP